MSKHRRIAGLDGLRGLAAAAVMLRHLGDRFRLPHLAPHGYLAVDLFFVLSGLVIARSYENRLDTGDMTSADFVQTRAIRLYPLVVMGALLGSAIQLVGRYSSGTVVEATLFAVLALPFPLAGGLFLANVPLWSMFYEVMSNLAYVVVRPLLRARTLLILLAASAIGVVIVCTRIGELDAGFAVQNGWAGAPRLAYPFLAGLAIHRLHGRGDARAAGLPFWTLAIALGVLLFLPQHTGGGWAVLDAAASLVVLPALVWLAIDAPLRPRLAAVCVLAGELSYPLYVLHQPIEVAVARLVSHAGGAERAATAAACTILIGVATWLAWTFYDKPLRATLQAWRASSRGARTPVVQTF